MTIHNSPSSAAKFALEQAFNRTAATVATAPGRVNLIGEHTDYNDGFVFPAAIEFHTAVAASPRADRLIRVVAHDADDQIVEFSLDDTPKNDADALWSNYVRGVVGELRGHGFELTGADLGISGNVPMGAGLSSSASLEMAVIKALTELSGESIDPSTAATLGQAAENNFVGCNCGIMDQLVSAAGRKDCAMLLDCRSLEIEYATIPQELTILVVDSKVERRLVDGLYNERRRQCEEVAQALGIAALRDASLTDLTKNRSRLDPTALKRARHVVSENQRTLDMADALTRKDIPTISSLMRASHHSMRDDFEITIPEIDALVSMTDELLGNSGGVRMTGGGFGGCIVALAPHHLIAPLVERIAVEYPKVTGHLAETHLCHASNGSFAT